MFRSYHLLVLLLGLLLIPTHAQAADEVLIIETSTDIDLLAAEFDATVLGSLVSLGVYRISAEASQLDALKLDARITEHYADSELDTRPSYFIGTSDILAPDPTDTIGIEQYSNQDAVQTLRLADAQTVSTGQGVTIAVIDTGAESDHPLLNGKLVAGYDFLDQGTMPNDIADGLDTDNDGSSDDAAGHGSHVSAIIALVAPDAKIMPIRIFDSNGRGLNFTLAQAIVYAVDQGVDIINLSANSDTDLAFVEQAIDYAWQNGVVVVTAAGINKIGFPASYDNAISVASTNNTGYRTTTSQFGSEEVDVYAPGESIMSAYYGGRYARWTGHSMATPFISGVAALMLATGSCDHECVRAELLSYARWVDRYVSEDTYLLPDFYDAVGAAANQQEIDVAIQSRLADEDAVDNNIRKVQFRLNNLEHSIPFEELTLRYWYTNEDSADEIFYCDWAAVGCENIIGTFGTETRSAELWQYFEIAFSADAGNLFGDDSSGEIHIRTNHVGWANYDESNDYSYNNSRSFIDWDKINLYQNGRLIAGSSPLQSAVSAVALQQNSATTTPSAVEVATMALLFLTVYVLVKRRFRI